MNNVNETKLFLSNPDFRLVLRPADTIDLPPLAILLETYREQYFDDYDSCDMAFLARLIASGEMLVMDDCGYAAGAVWYNNRFEDLHVTLHLLVKPDYWRRMLRDNILPEVIDYAFETLGVQKIKAIPLKSQFGAIKLLKRFLFKQRGYLKAETRKNGVLTDKFIFELHREYWRDSLIKHAVKTGR